MIEVVLLDADGVVIAKRQKYFSDRLVTDFGVSPEEAQGFVKNTLAPAFTGKTDLRQTFPPLLTKWGINKPLDEVFRYWWSAESHLNNDVLGVVDQIRKGNRKSYLASDQERNRGVYIMKDLGLERRFDGAFMSYELGVQKHSREFFEKVLKSLGIQDPSKVLFWDDDQKNVDIAEEVGLTSRFYREFEAFRQENRKLGLIP